MPDAFVATEARAAAGSAVRPSRARYGVLALIAGATMINYLDRTILGIAAPSLSKDLGIDAAMMGLVFSIFSWSYVLAQVPGGLLLDRLGSRLTYFLSLVLWSAFTLIQGFATGLWSLLIMRLGLGFSEAPAFPTNNRVVASWFPANERALATGTYTVGEYIGLACFSPMLFALMAAFTWRSLFWVVGAVGILYGVLWWWRYRDPQRHPRVNRAELDYIEAGGGLTTYIPKQERARFQWRDIGQLLKYRQFSGICVGQFAGNSMLVFFLTWFPSYLSEQRHMEWLHIGFFAIAPFLAAAVGVLFGGWFSDYMLRRGVSVNIARKLPIITGLLLASVIVAANYIESNTLVIVVMSVAFFAQGMAALGWTLVADIAPAKHLGLAGGIFNLAANLAGIITPLVVGFIVSASGSFAGALLYISAMALLGALAYIFMVGDIKRIEME
ncbi:MFS transporter [Phytohalomonas tamaricis]|uniref:MFS transporter n=1 Tax=Phytohalomonas tamaricis TaxID=2081032 RepID=UPI000D0B0E30|nr:MFS transporter [Phytohalomonas tamaricis]